MLSVEGENLFPHSRLIVPGVGTFALEQWYKPPIAASQNTMTEILSRIHFFGTLPFKNEFGSTVLEC